ncbi:Icl1f [Symbiodinium sp. CCMP2456]|nr:Icl1f [Symbiodinium sp. CCMP2456]
MNMILRYKGPTEDLQGTVLRLRKGAGSSRQLASDSRFQQEVLQPVLEGHVAFGTLVEVSQSVVERLNIEPSIQQSRRPERLSAKVRDLDTSAVGGPPSFVWGTLCPDLTYCPQGRTYELKPKLGVEDCLLPECQSLSRFTLLQCIDYPKKKRSISRYNPSALFRAIFAGDGAAVSEQLRHLRRASADPRQNNFRVLGGTACDASDAELEDLKEVLLQARGVFAKLRAFGLLAAGAAVEEAAQELYAAAGSPTQLGPEVFEEAFTHSGTALLARLEADMDDEAAIELVRQTYRDLRPQWGLALFLLGRSIQDASLVVNVRRMQPGESLASFRALRYAEVDEVRQLIGRITIIDTDIKPADRLPQYAKTLQAYSSHRHVEHLRSFLREGQNLDESLSSVQALLDRATGFSDGAAEKRS